MRYQPLILLLFFWVSESYAGMTDELSQFVGYTIVASKTIAGYQDKEGKKKDDFEGCDYGRTIIFDDDKIIHCSSYGYQYAYRPTAIILSNGSTFKMIVEDDIYDVQR